MQSDAPYFEYWRNLPAIKIWEAAVLMCGVDPRALANFTVQSLDPTDTYGVPLNFDDELRMLTAAVSTGKLSTLSEQLPSINEHTEVLLDTLVNWLGCSPDYANLAYCLDRTKPLSHPAAGVAFTACTESAEQRQDRRLKQCDDAGLTMDSKALQRLPNGIGEVAKREGVSRQTYSADIRIALKRRIEENRAGSSA